MSRTIQILAGIVFCTGCTAWIDDFQIDPDGTSGGTDTTTSTSSDGDTDVDSDSDSDGDTDPDISCGIMISPPSGESIEFCESDGSTFHMGCNESFNGETCEAKEIPRHEVTLSAFEIQRYEVTCGQYESFVLDRPEWARGGSAALASCNSSYLADWPDGSPGAGLNQKPVLWVCWEAAEAFCQWVKSDMALPTEAMWESAARVDPTGAGPYTIYPFGDNTNCTIANYEGCEGGPLNVGQTSGESPLGLYDMGGNAWEWIRDWHRDDYYCDPDNEGYTAGSCNDSFDWTDPTGDSTGNLKGVRGGSWYHPHSMMRSAGRNGFSPNMSSNLIGFRCAR